MTDPRIALEVLVAAELSRPVAPQAAAVTADIRRRHGSAVRAVLFYGSCLRKQRPEEGVLDLYALVSDYASAYGGAGPMSISNALLPPNVFYVEMPVAPGSVVRAKYAVISLDDFAKAAEPECLHSIVSGRFSQPTVLAWADGEAARTAVTRACAQAVLTMVLRTTALLASPASTGGEARAHVRSEDLWQRAFYETYNTELRTERKTTIASLYDAARDRYDRCADLAFAALTEEGVLDASLRGDSYDVRLPERLRRRLVAGWRLRRPLAKSLYAVRLVKSAVTFGDWLPYAAWKLARHTGVRVETTERQRRHPFVYGLPIILRLLWQQKLR